MFSFNIKTCAVTGMVLCGLVVWHAAEARIIGQYFYEFTDRDRSDGPDEAYSSLGLRIRDNLISTKSRTLYDLDSRLIYDHKNNVTNEQFSGFFSGKYMFIQQSLWWNYFGEIDVIPLDGGIEIDPLRSQNISTVSTGPTISLWKNLRGSLDLTALASKTNYSDRNFDSKGQDITLDYFNPYSEITSLKYSMEYQKVNYDDVSNAADDYEKLGAGILIRRDTGNSNFEPKIYLGPNDRRIVRSNIELLLKYNEVRNINNSSTESDIKLITAYQINRYSNVAMGISDSLLSADEFNRLGDNPDNVIFESGLFRDKRLQLSYGYATTKTSSRILAYVNQLEKLFDTAGTSGEINGAAFHFSNDIKDNLNLFVGLESTDDEINNQKSEEVIVAATYTRRHSKRVFSELEFTIRNRRVNNVDSDDTWIQYRITSAIF